MVIPKLESRSAQAAVVTADAFTGARNLSHIEMRSAAGHHSGGLIQAVICLQKANKPPQDAHHKHQQLHRLHVTPPHSLQNFDIRGEQACMPSALIKAFGHIKKSAAIVNATHGLDPKVGKAICQAADEVISNQAIKILGGELGSKKHVHPNDHVNMFPTAMHVVAVVQIKHHLIPSLESLISAIAAKREAFKEIIKIGRTHLQDVTPLTLGQEFSAYEQQLLHSLDWICAVLP
ncbi:L-Aspartase-like protein [Melampsora americana]|nr:L-Aspartase-like protein [Melampsora americana]